MDQEEDKDFIEYSNEQDDYDYGIEYSQLESAKSSATVHYKVVSSKTILEQIYNEIEKVMALTCINFSYALELYYQCHWTQSTVYKLLDEKCSFKDLISYNPNYTQLQVSNKECCEVCLEENYLWINPCGHKFCEDCWRMMLETSVFTSSELLPKCQGDQCEVHMNYQLIKVIINKKGNESIKQKFESLMVLSYSRENSSVKVCPNLDCERKFFIMELSSAPIECPCGALICTFCGDFFHIPIDCAEMKNWNKMVADQQNQWIEIVRYKICPSCKNPIEKNEGCNHMTCRCKHQFCWICLQNWSTHGQCRGQQEHARMEEQRQKMLKDQNQYRQKFEICKEETLRFDMIIRRIANMDMAGFRQSLMRTCAISVPQTDYLSTVPPVLIVGYRLCKNSKIFKFFRGQQNLQSIHAHRIAEECDYLDEYVTELKSLYQKLVNGGKWEENVETIREMTSGAKKSEIINRVSQLKQFQLKIIENR